ncbi:MULTISPECIES: hypothetical protein [unclassified Psychrobacillus]|uniref:hypothetical protein n=1 Tax=unclassified Psychrobacillus TaxID=2636677 RepID=UPI0030F8A4B8
MQEVPMIVRKDIEDYLHANVPAMKRRIYTQVMRNEFPDEQVLIDFLLEERIGIHDGNGLDMVGMRKTHFNKRQIMKRDWYKKLLAEIEKGNNPVAMEFNTMDALITANDLDSGYVGVEDEDEYIAKRMDAVEKWIADKTQHITDYPFLFYKPTRSVKNAFLNDLSFLISKYILDKYGPTGNIYQEIEHNPSLVSTPAFSERSSSEVMIPSENPGLLTGEYTSWNKNVTIRTLVDLKDGDELMVPSWNPDTVDMKIIRHILRQKTSSFYLDRKISFPIGPLVKDVYGSRAGRHYEEAQKRLFKIKMMSFMMKVRRREPGSKGTDLSWSFLDSVSIDKDALIAQVVVNEAAFEQLINEDTIRIYHREIDSLRIEFSQLLVHLMQKERLRIYVEGDNSEGYYGLVDFFSTQIRIDEKSPKDAMNKIEDSLKEFCKLEIIISSYTRQKDGFLVKFKEFSDAEVVDYKLSTSNSTGIDNTGTKNLEQA